MAQEQTYTSHLHDIIELKQKYDEKKKQAKESQNDELLAVFELADRYYQAYLELERLYRPISLPYIPSPPYNPPYTNPYVNPQWYTVTIGTDSSTPNPTLFSPVSNSSGTLALTASSTDGTYVPPGGWFNYNASTVTSTECASEGYIEEQ